MSINHLLLVKDSVARFSDLMQQRRKLIGELARIEKDIVKVQKTLRWAAARLSQDNVNSGAQRPEISIDEPRPLGFTDAVRTVLRNYPVWLTPILVRDLLATVGFDISGYQNALSTVHCLLGRLVASGEVIQGKTIADKPAYLSNGANCETQ